MKLYLFLDYTSLDLCHILMLVTFQREWKINANYLNLHIFFQRLIKRNHIKKDYKLTSAEWICNITNRKITWRLKISSSLHSSLPTTLCFCFWNSANQSWVFVNFNGRNWTSRSKLHIRFELKRIRNICVSDQESIFFLILTI